MTADRNLYGGAVETFVADYMRGMGMVILEQNYTVGKMEVDIIGMEESTLVIVEVKARTHAVEMKEVTEVISADKNTRMVRVADVYAQRCRFPFSDIRFDYAFVHSSDTGLECTYVRDAFIP